MAVTDVLVYVPAHAYPPEVISYHIHGVVDTPGDLYHCGMHCVECLPHRTLQVGCLC